MPSGNMAVVRPYPGLKMEDLVAPRSDERDRMEEELLAQIREVGESYLSAAAE
jgi:hypothetical protein